MHKLTGVFAVVSMCVAGLRTADADPIYYWGFDQANLVSGDPQAGTAVYSYTTTPVLDSTGAPAYYTCTVNVYLYEYSAGTGETYIAPTPPNAAEGLANAGVALTQTGGSTDYTVTATGSSSFDSFSEYLSTDLAPGQVTGVLSFQDGTTNAGVTGTAVDDETTKLLVGTFSFTVGLDAIPKDSPITFVTSDLHDWMSDNFTFATETDLDTWINSSGPPILTVVPEPPSVVALSGLAAMGALMWVVRRARRFRRV
jgi:hypothetical protein